MPTVIPPGDITFLDRFSRADGNVWAGDGATLWSDEARDGSASLLRVSGGKLVATAEGGGLTLEDDADGIRIFTVSNTGSGYLMFFFRMVGGDGYGLSMLGGIWTLYEVTGGVTFTPVDEHPTAGGGLNAGGRVGIRFVDDAVSVHLGNADYLATDPIWESTGLTNTGAGACGFQMANAQWAIDDYSDGGLVAPTTAVEMFVDPDHPDASDEYNRTQASDPDTPFRTVDAACWLVRAGVSWHDTVTVKNCVTEDLGDANDPHIQPALDYRAVANRGLDAIGWPFGDNVGNEPIVLRGDVTAPDPFDAMDPAAFVDLPKILAFHHRGLNNWVIQDLQFGYDLGEDFAFGTLSGVERVTDVEYRRCLFTGGLAIVSNWAAAFNVIDCWIEAPLGSTGLRPGAGLNLTQTANDGSGLLSVGQFTTTGTVFKNIRGEDAIASFGLYSFDSDFDDMENNVIDCVFWNVTEGNPIFHTDSIQLVAVPNAVVDRNVFIGCSDALIVSDELNGHIEFTRNLTVGINSPVIIQGTEELVIAQNEFNHADSPIKDASLFFSTRTAVDTVATIVNNVLGGFFMNSEPIDTYFADGTVIENNIVMSNPGLVTAWGTNLPGIAELGVSSRLDAIPNDTILWGVVDRNWELANTPITSPGVGQGGTYDLGLDVDLLGRAFASPPDVGCFQSDAGTPVTPTARPPYVTSRSPLANATGVAASASVTATLYPVPGAEIEPTSVTTSTAYVTDSANFTIPAEVTLSSPDGGYQTITIDLKASLSPVTEGELYPLVNYTAHLTGDIEDEDGSALGATTWTFRVVGPGTAAITVPVPTGITLSPDLRFRPGTTLQVFNASGGAQPVGTTVVTSAVVAADSTVTFTGLAPGRYVAGESVAGPFAAFNV